MENFEILRACFGSDFRNDPDTKLHLQINEEMTKALKAQPKHVNFKKWCDDNGIKYPGVDYPTCFGPNGQLIGMAAKTDISPMQAFLYVPTNLVISVYNLRKRNPPLALIFDKHPEIFKTHRDAEYNTMVIYVMQEI